MLFIRLWSVVIPSKKLCSVKNTVQPLPKACGALNKFFLDLILNSTEWETFLPTLEFFKTL